MKLPFLKDSKLHTYAHLFIVFKQLALFYIKLLIVINCLGISGKSINLGRVILYFDRRIICLPSEGISLSRAIYKCVICCKSPLMDQNLTSGRTLVRSNVSGLILSSLYLDQSFFPCSTTKERELLGGSKIFQH